MLSFPGSIRVFLCVEPCDMRKSFNGLDGIVSGKLGEDTRSLSVVKRLQRIAKAGKKNPQAAGDVTFFLEIEPSGADTDCRRHAIPTLMDPLEPAWTDRKVAQKWHSSRNKASTKSPL